MVGAWLFELLDRDEALGARRQELKDEYVGAPGSLDDVDMARRFGEEVTRRVRSRAAVTVDDVEAAAEDVDIGRSAVDVLQAGARGQGEAAGEQ